MIGKGRALVGTTLLPALLLAGCSDRVEPQTTAPSSSASLSPSVRTFAPLPPPLSEPATGRLYPDLRQSSRDAALGRMQVWIRNDRERDLRPNAIRYLEDRYSAPLPGGRLRLNPARSIRGYTLTLPSRPACDSDATTGRVVVERGGLTQTLPVEDEADVVARHLATRCFELRVTRVATVSFADEVPVDRPGEGSIGTLVLRVVPSGRPGAGSVTVDSVAGTPLLSSYQTPFWTPDLIVASTDDAAEVELPVHPARCDEHVFMESGGATAFRVKLRLTGQGPGTEGELIVRMSPAGASAAIGFARDSCGYSD